MTTNSSAFAKLSKDTTTPQVDKKSPAEKTYKILRTTKIIRADGSILKPVGNILHPVTAEETQLCEYFQAKGLLE